MHGFKGFKDWGMFPLVAERLARAGMSAVSFNVSGSGVDDLGEFSRGEQFGRNTYTAELEDLHRTIQAVKGGSSLDFPAPTSLGLLGHSRGGGMSILEAGRNRDIDALVTWAAIGTVDRWSSEAKAAWRRRGFVNIQNARTGQVIPLGTGVLDDIETNAGSLDIMAAAGKIRAPWLIVHGESDETVDVTDATDLKQASPSGAELLIIPGGGHTFGAAHPLKDVAPPLDQALNATVGWFSRHLR
jgi:fermentation-respiration switch protein FrsA (DUF1100 family)